MEEVRRITVRRLHGLGNVIMLLPVLNQLAEQGTTVHLITRTEWTSALQQLNPQICISDQDQPDAFDLDQSTQLLKPRLHRTNEFADILGVAHPVSAPVLKVPAAWSAPFAKWKDSVGFAPEAGHPSRQWPHEYCVELASSLCGSPLVVLGMQPASPALNCDFDTRGQFELEELLGLLAILRLLICLDSGMLHLGAAMGIRTICIFGGLNPAFRIGQSQRVLALQAALDCCPCDKNETCGERYECVRAVKPHDVLKAMADDWPPVTVVRRI